MIFPVSFWKNAATPPGSYLLDLPGLSGAVGAWSLRLLRAAYAGPCINCTRASDSATQDFGFVGGVLDTASLLTFGAGTDVYINTAYDQSGQGNDELAVFGPGDVGPKIVSGGALVTGNLGLPAALQDPSTNTAWFGTSGNPAVLDFESTDPFSAFGVASVNDVSASRFIFGKDRESGFNGGWYVFIQPNSSPYFFMQAGNGSYCGVVNATGIVINTPFLLQAINDGSGNAGGINLLINGGSNKAVTANFLAGTIKNSAKFTLGSRNLGDAPNLGLWQETIVWPSRLTGTPLTTATNDIMTYYGL